jgi:hypothetical protein
MRLSSDIWVYALIRRAELGGAFATLARKGDARGGAVLVKTFDRRSGVAKLWAEAVGPGGDSVWMRPIASEAERDVDAYIARSARIDPDIWVVEIEDADGRRFLTEAVTDD